MGILGKYINGNTKVVIFNDGTLIKQTEDDEFKWDFPNSADVKITNQCDIGCKFCHENSIPNGRHGDIKNLKFFDTLHPYTEIALGGGNILTHPNIDWLLRKLRDQKVIANITINQTHFLKEYDRIKKWYDEGLVKGIGVSFNGRVEGLIDKLKSIPTIVVHVINGIFTEIDFNYLKNNDLNLLILGYKDLRRGHNYLSDNSESLMYNKKWLSNNLEEVSEGFRAIAFDNLAVKQLPVKEVAGDSWENLFQGEDGKESGTMYIDCVNEEYSLSSTSMERYKIKDSIDDMFQALVKKESA